jgi:DNA replication and repair protein RecF
VIVTALQLTDFRSYAAVELELGAGATVFLGSNGQGKTNLVEAVEYLASLSSHRVANDQPLVRAGAQRAVLRARVQAAPDDARSLALDLEIRLGAANQARLNKAPVRPRDLLGAIRVVLFAPEDLAIVKGDPGDRRVFIDALSTTRWPRLAGVRADLERVLRQRNSLLKAMSGRAAARSSAGDTLELWDERLVALGAELVAARLDSVARLEPLYADRYASLAASVSQVRLAYRSAVEPDWATGQGPRDPDQIAARLSEAIVQRRDEEIARGLSLVGPQRDDLVLELDGLPVKGYASHGESWSASLGLRLGSFDLLRQDGVEPVLILDDVFAELDSSRRDRLAQAIGVAQQVLLTAAVEQDVPSDLAAARFQVADGQVHSSAHSTDRPTPPATTPNLRRGTLAGETAGDNPVAVDDPVDSDRPDRLIAPDPGANDRAADEDERDWLGEDRAVNEESRDPVGDGHDLDRPGPDPMGDEPADRADDRDSAGADPERSGGDHDPI